MYFIFRYINLQEAMYQLSLNILSNESNSNLVTVKEASRWASTFLSRNISNSNISYLIQYGKIQTFDGGLIDIAELQSYYNSYLGNREIRWKEKLGDDLNWALSFDHLREKDTTKHVHRLHPYKGKYIPQLVEYFIDSHIDSFKRDIFFNKGDTILDPFSGSGTTLVQANELGINSIGIDISKFNCSIAEAKLSNYQLHELEEEIANIIFQLNEIPVNAKIMEFEKELSNELSMFNQKHFPSPQFKRKVYKDEIDEDVYSQEKEKKFLDNYHQLLQKYNIKLQSDENHTFLDKWYIKNIYDEIKNIYALSNNIKNKDIKNIVCIILSRTIRSCRATMHSDLATLKEPQFNSYYCHKHKKICKPIFSSKNWFIRYANDTVARLKEFSTLRTNAYSTVLSANSQEVDIISEVTKNNLTFGKLLSKNKISGIFSSPPYVGQIDYHEQHAYAYDLFGFERNDELEIGPLYKGKGKKARDEYAQGIAAVLKNARKYMIDDFNVFLVANDKWNLYPEIAKQADMKIINSYERPVLNRTERDKNPYSETIFHLKKC